jgi:hypothetical protein
MIYRWNTRVCFDFICCVCIFFTRVHIHYVSILFFGLAQLSELIRLLNCHHVRPLGAPYACLIFTTQEVPTTDCSAKFGKHCNIRGVSCVCVFHVKYVCDSMAGSIWRWSVLTMCGRYCNDYVWLCLEYCNDCVGKYCNDYVWTTVTTVFDYVWSTVTTMFGVL